MSLLRLEVEGGGYELLLFSNLPSCVSVVRDRVSLSEWCVERDTFGRRIRFCAKKEK